MVRALELAATGGSLVPERNRLWSADNRRPTLVVGLDVPVDELVQRIRSRTEAMFELGVVDEVRTALAGPVSITAEKALGLREIVTLPREEALERLRGADAAVCRLPAQVDAQDPGPRQRGCKRVGAEGGR